MDIFTEEDILEDDNVDAVEAISYRRNVQARIKKAIGSDDEGPEQSD